jgi:hypothetical protein
MLIRTFKTTLLATGILAAVIGGNADKAIAQSREMWLYTGGQSMVEGTFYAGERIYGWCDQDCYDLDLMLYDTNNNLLSQDVATDAQPVVAAPYAGQFRIMVTMPNCNHQAGCAAWVDSDAHF